MGATITYKDSVVAELNGGQTKKIKVKGKYMDEDILVEAAEVGGVAELWDGTGVIIVSLNEYGETVIVDTFTEETNEYGITVIV